MEHWLPLYYERLETLFDYLPGAAVSLDHQAEEARAAPARSDRRFLRGAAEHRGVGRSSRGAALPAGQAGAAVSRRRRNGQRLLASAPRRASSRPFAAPERDARRVRCRRAAGENFAAERADPKIQSLRGRARPSRRRAQIAGKRAAIAAYSAGSADRLAHGAARARRSPICAAVADWRGARQAAALGASGSRSWRSSTASRPTTLVAAQRAGHARRPPGAAAAPARAISTISSPRRRASQPGDLVVHVEHGIGRYDGLETHRGRRRAA